MPRAEERRTGRRRRRSQSRGLTTALVLALAGSAGLGASPPEAPPGGGAPPGLEARLGLESFRLDNGMAFLVVDRPEPATVAAGWVAHVGSAHDPPGRSGLAHLLEHLMFGGSRTIGTRDAEREAALLAAQEEVRDEIRRLRRRERAARLRGETAPAPAEAQPRGTAAELAALTARLEALEREHRDLLIDNELDLVYARQGATGINAFTTGDLTAYFVAVPAEKLELWFWMESDRLAEPVFRGLYRELPVIDEERRRSFAAPGGEHEELLDGLFWQVHPYRWPRLGWAADLELMGLADVARHFETYYAPGNLTAVLVGPVSRVHVEALAQRYFGRIPARPAPPDLAVVEPAQTAEKRLLAACSCPEQARLRFHTVPVRHPDAAPLAVAAGLLSTAAGRLHRRLVEERGLATEAWAEQRSWKLAGAFTLGLTARGDATAAQLAEAGSAVLASLAAEAPDERELLRVKNRLAADSYRRLEDPFLLMVQLLVAAGLGDWRQGLEEPLRLQAVTAEDVARVAHIYFRPENRTVALYHRREADGAGSGDAR